MGHFPVRHLGRLRIGEHWRRGDGSRWQHTQRCSGMPYRKLLKLDVPLNALKHIIISHGHIDHMYSLPSLLDSLGIAGRKEEIHIYAIKETLEIIEPLLDLWDLRTRDYCNFPITLHIINGEENELVFQDSNFTVRTAPTSHAVPSFATRVTLPNGAIVVYSSDTAPCPALTSFAKGSKYFLLECTYCNNNAELSVITGHFYSRQFAEVCAEVGARYNLLVHHSASMTCSNDQLLREIRAANNSSRLDVIIPADFDRIDLE